MRARVSGRSSLLGLPLEVACSHRPSTQNLSSVAVTKSQDDTEANNYETMKRTTTYTLVRALESEMIKKVKAGKAQVAETKQDFR